jgi:hypothetical protein
MLGRRADDEGVAPIATHTICDGCLETLRASGILGKGAGRARGDWPAPLRDNGLVPRRFQPQRPR